MVSLIGWIVTTGSCEDFVLIIVDEPEFIKMTRDDSIIWDEDVALEVLMVLVSVEQCRIHQLLVVKVV